MTLKIIIGRIEASVRVGNNMVYPDYTRGKFAAVYLTKGVLRVKRSYET